MESKIFDQNSYGEGGGGVGVVVVVGIVKNLS